MGWEIHGKRKGHRVFVPDADVDARLKAAALTPPATAEDAKEDGAALWVWRNGPGQFVAYNDEYPCYENGDPKTLGEPIGIATLQPYTKSPVSVAAYRTMISATPPSAEAKPGLTEREQQTVDSVRSEISKRKSYIDMADGEIDCAVLLAIITRLTTGGQKS